MPNDSRYVSVGVGGNYADRVVHCFFDTTRLLTRFLPARLRTRAILLPELCLAARVLVLVLVFLSSAPPARAQLPEWDGETPFPVVGQPAKCEAEYKGISSACLVQLPKPAPYSGGVNNKEWFPIDGYSVVQKLATGVYRLRPDDNPLISLTENFLWLEPLFRGYCSVQSVSYTPIPSGGYVETTVVNVAFRGWQGTKVVNANNPPNGGDGGGGYHEQPTDYDALDELPGGFTCTQGWLDEGASIVTCVPN